MLIIFVYELIEACSDAVEKKGTEEYWNNGVTISKKEKIKKREIQHDA